MQCDEVHAYLAEKLAGRLADKVSGTLQAYVRMHMQSCPDCCEQLDDFEEIHATFRLIPLEACDSDAMRLRFQRFMDAEDARIYRASVRHVMAHLTPRWWPGTLSRPLAIAGVAAVLVIAGAFALVTVRQAMRPRISSPEVSSPVVTLPVPKPANTPSEPLVVPAESAVPSPPLPISPPPIPILPAPVPGISANAKADADASEDIPIAVTLRLDTGERLPYKPDTSIVLTDSEGRFHISALAVVGNLFQASVPSGKSYSISVSNVASGYAILSIISGTIDLMNGGRITPVANSSAPPKIVVTLRKQ